jgi:single-strand DNA-binding protein
MGSVNVATLIGHLGRDAEVRYTSGGAAVANFSMATTEVWTDRSGQRQERTEWHTVELWGKTAEALADYLVKGKQVYVSGRIQTDEYTDREGVKRRATKIRGERVVLLGGGSGGDRAPARSSRLSNAEAARGFSRPSPDDPYGQEQSAEGSSAAYPLSEDDIPF